MESQREIKFVTTQSKNRLTEGKTCYQGLLRHNAVLSERETRKAFATYCGEPASKTNRYVDSLGEFIALNVQAGNRLDFGSFAAELRIRGGFKSANAPFTPGTNALNVELIAGKDIRRATEALKPVNVTDGGEKWRIDGILQKRPVQTYDWIPAEGECLVSAVGLMPEVHQAVADEGVWIENDKGVRLATGEIVRTEFGLAETTLRGPIPPGNHWFVLQGRQKDSPNLIHVRRRVKVVVPVGGSSC